MTYIYQFHNVLRDEKNCLKITNENKSILNINNDFTNK